MVSGGSFFLPTDFPNQIQTNGYSAVYPKPLEIAIKRDLVLGIPQGDKKSATAEAEFGKKTGQDMQKNSVNPITRIRWLGRL
jgi:hypothetical protein